MTCRVQADGGGLRYSEGKAPVHLVHPDFIIELAHEMERLGLGPDDLALLPVKPLAELVAHYAKGAKKYAPRNWERGMPWSKVYGPLLRHAFALWRRQDRDPETNTHHAIVVAWNAFALYVYHDRGIGTDDRPGPQARDDNDRPIASSVEANRIIDCPPTQPSTTAPLSDRASWLGSICFTKGE